MKVLAFDLSKAATGVAFIDKGSLEHFQTIQFENTKQWDLLIRGLVTAHRPDAVVFSETVNRMCSHTTKRILFGLMYHLELVCYEYNVTCIPINDTKAKNAVGIKMKKRDQIKKDTIDWVKSCYNVDVSDDEADAICFAHYISHHV